MTLNVHSRFVDPDVPSLLYGNACEMGHAPNPVPMQKPFEAGPGERHCRVQRKFDAYCGESLGTPGRRGGYPQLSQPPDERVCGPVEDCRVHTGLGPLQLVGTGVVQGYGPTATTVGENEWRSICDDPSQALGHGGGRGGSHPGNCHSDLVQRPEVLFGARRESRKRAPQDDGLEPTVESSRQGIEAASGLTARAGGRPPNAVAVAHAGLRASALATRTGRDVGMPPQSHRPESSSQSLNPFCTRPPAIAD